LDSFSRHLVMDDLCGNFLIRIFHPRAFFFLNNSHFALSVFFWIQGYISHFFFLVLTYVSARQIVESLSPRPFRLLQIRGLRESTAHFPFSPNFSFFRFLFARILELWKVVNGISGLLSSQRFVHHFLCHGFWPLTLTALHSLTFMAPMCLVKRTPHTGHLTHRHRLFWFFFQNTSFYF